MRIANVRGRLTVLESGSQIDVEQASRGRFSADPQAVYADWAGVPGVGADRRAGSAPRGPATSERRRRSRPAVAASGAGVRDRPQLCRPRRRGRVAGAGAAAGLHEVPDLSRRARTPTSSCRARPSTGKSSWSS